MKKIKLIKGEGYPIYSFEEVNYPPRMKIDQSQIPKHLRDVCSEISEEKLDKWKNVVKQYLDLQDFSHEQ